MAGIKIKLGDREVVVDQARHKAFQDSAADMQRIANLGDSPEALAFVISQLAYTENQLFERQYLPMQYEDLLPITFEAGEHADQIRYEIYDWSGRGKRLNSRSKDIPKVDVAMAEKYFPVVNGGIGYDYTTEELRRTAFLRRPVSERKLVAAMEGYRRHMNDVGLYGESGGLTGLYNSPLVPQGNAPTGNWAVATPANILKDINALIQNVWTNTAYNDQITHIVLAPGALAYIAGTARSDNSDKTILQFIKENNIAKTEKGIDIQFVAGFGLDTAGSGGTRRMMGYVKSDQRLVMHVPLPLRFLAPQMSAYLVEVPGEYKYSGVEFRYPKSAYYMDGV